MIYLYKGIPWAIKIMNYIYNNNLDEFVFITSSGRRQKQN